MPRPLYLARIDPRTRPDPPADPRPTRHRGQGIGGGAVRGDGRGFVFAVRLIVAVFLTVTERLRRFAPPPIPPGSARPPLIGAGQTRGTGARDRPPIPARRTMEAGRRPTSVRPSLPSSTRLGSWAWAGWPWPGPWPAGRSWQSPPSIWTKPSGERIPSSAIHSAKAGQKPEAKPVPLPLVQGGQAMR